MRLCPQYCVRRKPQVMKRRNNYYQSAVLLYWYMNPRCQLQVHWRQNWSAERNKNGQNRPKKRFKAKFSFCSFLYVQLPNFLRKKISHFTIPLKCSHGLILYLYLHISFIKFLKVLKWIFAKNIELWQIL